MCSKLNLVVLILSGLAVQGCSQQRATDASDESPQAEIELMFDQYIDTFSQAKWDAVDDFWRTPGGSPRVLNVSISPMMPCNLSTEIFCNNSDKMGIRTQTCLTQSLEFFNASCVASYFVHPLGP